MAVEMEGVDCGVHVVYYYLDNIAFGYYEWIYGSVDEGVGVVGAGAEGCE